jgi:hypothetical protein
MHLRVHRTDGKTGSYTQNDERRARTLLARLEPARLFSSGPIVIGVSNPFTVLNPDEVCWVEVETELETPKTLPRGLEHVERLAGREVYEAVLARQWPLWRKHAGHTGDLLEALVEVSMRSGEALYLRATGFLTHAPLVSLIFGGGALVATYAPHGTVYINPKCIVRTRVYHSRDQVDYPNGLWFAEADDI